MLRVKALESHMAYGASVGVTGFETGSEGLELEG